MKILILVALTLVYLWIMFVLVREALIDRHFGGAQIEYIGMIGWTITYVCFLIVYFT